MSGFIHSVVFLYCAFRSHPLKAILKGMAYEAHNILLFNGYYWMIGCIIAPSLAFTHMQKWAVVLWCNKKVLPRLLHVTVTSLTDT